MGEKYENIAVDPSQAPQPIEIFYSYSHEDEILRVKLEKHLSVLRRNGMIKGWHDRNISAGTEWKDSISEHLESARVILLLVSSDFLASDYCYDKEMMRAMERHEKGSARVIPVILRKCDWQDAPFGKLQALPKDAKPVKSWGDIDEALVDVVTGLRRVIAEIKQVP
ncbi:MAG: toll/interleukin-1 receptor domain-containing protein [Acidobacteria bacterium]|nr:toll/interleukin-1 receptor domain-containing protein [Acidobacteriota bacterium]